MGKLHQYWRLSGLPSVAVWDLGLSAPERVPSTVLVLSLFLSSSLSASGLHRLISISFTLYDPLDSAWALFSCSGRLSMNSPDHLNPLFQKLVYHHAFQSLTLTAWLLKPRSWGARAYWIQSAFLKARKWTFCEVYHRTWKMLFSCSETRKFHPRKLALSTANLCSSGSFLETVFYRFWGCHLWSSVNTYVFQSGC